jgi:ankyrin repeat protein
MIGIKLLCFNALLIGSASLAMHSDQNGQNADRVEELHQAAKTGNLELVRGLLAQNVPADARDYDSWTALMWAARNGSKEICQLLIDAKAQVDAISYDALTPLILATIEGRKKVCLLLIDANAQVDKKGKNGWTALMWAAWQGNRKVCQLLIDANAQVYAKDAGGWTALTCAARRNHHKICQLLIDAMLKHIKQNRARVIALLGIKKFNKAKCMNPIDRNVIQAIAHQIFDPAMTELCAQIDAIPNKKMRDEIRSYAQQQLKMKIDQDTNRDSHE